LNNAFAQSLLNVAKAVAFSSQFIYICLKRLPCKATGTTSLAVVVLYIHLLQHPKDLGKYNLITPIFIVFTIKKWELGSWNIEIEY